MAAPLKISAQLVVASLKEAVAETTEAQQHADAVRAERDALIYDAFDIIPMLRLVKITGLSRQRLYTIKTRRGQTDE